MYNYISVEYNGEEKSFNVTDGVGEAEFDYIDGLNSLRLRMDEIASVNRLYYDSVYYGGFFPVTWEGPYDEPVCTVHTGSVYEDYNNRIAWSIESPVGYPCAAVELLYFEKAPGAAKFTCTSLFVGKKTDGQFTHTVKEGMAGGQCYYRLAYCSYPYAEAPRDGNLTYGEVTTEIITIGETQKYPAAPVNLHATRPAVGGYSIVTFEGVTDPFNELLYYEIERQVNGGLWSRVYCGTSTTFHDKLTVKTAETVTYRVRSIDTEYDASEWTVSEPLSVLESNIYVMSGGTLRPAVQVYIGGQGAVGAVAFVG
ncbi:MAG: hypothetical protein E7638_03540 [Ruminococcaceae bacterium]|nr:hypothetical protein [Oscillospiraceae bacterium]